MRLIWLSLLLLLAVPSFASIGIRYNSTTNVYDLYNPYHDYYINSTSGWQMSNVPEEWWSHNEICLQAVITGNTAEKCTDSLPWTWTNATDNSTYADLNGTVNWVLASRRTLTAQIRYHLNTTDRRIKMTLQLSYTGSLTTTGNLIWRVHDIRINNTPENDYLWYLNASNSRDLLLNTTGLNEISTNVTNKSYILHDSLLGAWAQTDWQDNDATLHIFKNKTEYNAYVDLSFPFSFSPTSNTPITKTIWWEDALCSWSCYMTDPISEVTVEKDGTFGMEGQHFTTGGTCNPAGEKNTAQFSNNSGSTYNTITTSGNLTTNDPNPASGNMSYWTITGKDPWNTKYRVRVNCYFNLQNSYTGAQNVNVTFPPSGMTCTALSTDLSLSSDSKACYTISTNGLTINCNGKKLYGDSLEAGLNIANVNGLTIKNCNFENYTIVVNASKSQNMNFTNNTFKNTAVNSSSAIFDDNGFYILSNCNNTVIKNNTMVNITLTRPSGFVGGGDEIAVKATTVNNLTVSNFTVNDTLGDFNTGGGDPTYYRYSDMVVSSGTCSNFTFSNLYGKNVTYGYNLGGTCTLGCTITDSNVSMANYGVYSAINLTVNRFNVSGVGSFYSFTYGIYQLTANSNNFSNINVIGNGQTTGTGFRFSSANNSLVNATCFNTTTCYHDARPSSWSSVNNLTSNYSRYCLYFSTSTNNQIGYVNNAVCDYSNYSAYATYQSTGGILVSNGTFVYQQAYNIGTVWLSSLVTNLTFLNVSANFSNYKYQLGFGDNNFTTQWYARVNVTDSTGTALISTINVTNNQSTNEYNSYQSLSSYFIANDTKYGAVTNVSYNNHYIVVNRSGYTTNSSYFNISYRDATINITLYSTTPITNSCTYSGSGNWVINLADRCNITSSQYLPSNTITFNGTSGYVTFGNPTGATLIMTASRFYWNCTGSIYMWFKNSTWFNGSMGG